MRNNLFIAFCCLVVGACCPCRQAGVATAVADSDSVYTSHVDIVRLTIRDTILLQPLAQYHDRVQLEATSSFLENAYCTSAAAVDEDGVLTHTLDTRDSALMPVRTIYRDRVVRDTVIRLKDRVDVKQEIMIREVRKVTWYDKCLRVISAALFIIVLWQNRKRIIQIISLWRI